jgi:hypothetical protein
VREGVVVVGGRVWKGKFESKVSTNGTLRYSLSVLTGDEGHVDTFKLLMTTLTYTYSARWDRFGVGGHTWNISIEIHLSPDIT